MRNFLSEVNSVSKWAIEATVKHSYDRMVNRLEGCLGNSLERLHVTHAYLLPELYFLESCDTCRQARAFIITSFCILMTSTFPQLRLPPQTVCVQPSTLVCFLTCSVDQSNRVCRTFCTVIPELISVSLSRARMHSSALCFTWETKNKWGRLSNVHICCQNLQPLKENSAIFLPCQ